MLKVKQDLGAQVSKWTGWTNPDWWGSEMDALLVQSFPHYRGLGWKISNFVVFFASIKMGYLNCPTHQWSLIFNTHICIKSQLSMFKFKYLFHFFSLCFQQLRGEIKGFLSWIGDDIISSIFLNSNSRWTTRHHLFWTWSLIGPPYLNKGQLMPRNILKWGVECQSLATQIPLSTR